MNVLARDQTFPTTSSVGGCTSGIDICSATVPLRRFVDGTPPPDAGHGNLAQELLLMDLEGSGDQGLAYDIRLAVVALMTSTVLLLNWRGGVEVKKQRTEGNLKTKPEKITVTHRWFTYSRCATKECNVFFVSCTIFRWQAYCTS